MTGWDSHSASVEAQDVLLQAGALESVAQPFVSGNKLACLGYRRREIKSIIDRAFERDYYGDGLTENGLRSTKRDRAGRQESFRNLLALGHIQLTSTNLFQRTFPNIGHEQIWG